MEELENLDLNSCITFLTVAKAKSISKAANTLHVSQPAVSYSIKILEERLNCKLFIRTAKGVELTADARKLMYYVENAYNTLHTGFKMLNDSNDLLRGEIRIGVPTHICIFLISDIIEMFNENYPGIKFSIVNRSTAEMVDMLEKRELDLIVDSYPIYSSKEDITIVDLFNVDNCFVASSKYSSLLKSNTRINLKDLSKYSLLLQPEKTSTRKALEAITNDLKPNIEVATTEVMLDLVQKGLGIGYFSKMSVLKLIQSGELIEIPIKEELPKTQICIAYVKELLTNAPKKFVEVITERTNVLDSLRKKNIRLILSQDCVYNCEFCHKEGIRDKRENLLNVNDIKYMYKVINENYSINTVHLTGGEPLLKKDLKDIITSLKEEGAIIKITTNGYFLKENLWIGDMVDKINISLHSINKEKYEEISKVKDSYDKVINGIKELRFQYPTLKIGINTVLLRNVNDSKDEIEGLIKFSSSIKADLKFIEAYPKNIKGYVDINEIIKKIETMGYIHQKNNFRKSVFSDGSHTIYIQKCTCSAVSEKEDKQSVCKENNDIYITQDGIINLCRQSDEKINLYNIIKNRKDGELIKVIKDVYYQMGNNCKC